MFVELGAAGFARHSDHLGSVEDDLLGQPAYAVALLERDARKGGHIDGHRPFIEWG